MLKFVILLFKLYCTVFFFSWFSLICFIYFLLYLYSSLSLIVTSQLYFLSVHILTCKGVVKLNVILQFAQISIGLTGFHIQNFAEKCDSTLKLKL